MRAVGGYRRDDRPVEERFWAGVEKGSDTQCWPWQYGTVKGYGRFWLRAGELDEDRPREARAHRVAFRLIHGRWPEPMGLHGCDNPVCCNALNPLHIHEGDNSLNMLEMFARDRQADARRSGESHFRALFSNEQVREIRRLASTGGRGICAELARRYDVPDMTMSRIIRRQCYAEVSDG